MASFEIFACTPFTHLKTSSARFRHQGMVISCTDEEKGEKKPVTEIIFNHVGNQVSNIPNHSL